MGFVTPQNDWMRLLLPKIRTLLLDEPLRSGQFLSRSKLQQQLEHKPLSIGTSALWQTVNLEMWMRVFDVE